MCCFVILLSFNEIQMSVRRFSAIPDLRACNSVGQSLTITYFVQVEIVK